jgi:parallel beta-helix repeat protein
MARFSLRQWWYAMVRSVRSGRRRPDWPGRQRIRLFLESLEDRRVPSTVMNLNDAGLGSLRQAIIDTPSSGTVDFQPGLSGTITLMTGEMLIDKNLTITGPGADVITISGNHASRVFNITASSTVAITGLTAANGVSSMGGGIFNSGTLTIISCVIRDNNATDLGGGVESSGPLNIIDSVIIRNTATDEGGGILTFTADSGSTVTITDSTISLNTTPGHDGINGVGGGIRLFNSGWTLIMSNSNVSDNSALSGGGISITTGAFGILSSCNISLNTALGGGVGTFGGGIQDFGTLVMTGCTVSGNTGGAGIYSSFGSNSTVINCAVDNNIGQGITNVGLLSLSNSTISANTDTGLDSTGTAQLLGCTISDNMFGGIIISGRQSTIINCTISRNTYPGTGGGILFGGVGSTLSIMNSTISGNSSGSYGGGIAKNDNAFLTIANTIVAGNTAPDFSDVSGVFDSHGHNLIGDGTGGSGFAATDLVGTADFPIDPKLGLLQDNGGPTFTMALLPDSPAINAGDPTGAPEWDQRGPGFPRVVNGKIDIGAYEHQAVAPTITCSVAQPLLWPPNHQLVNVGLSVTVDPPDANLHILVYANDNASPADAADIGPGTLLVRSERQGSGTGRVYLIVVTATNSAGTSFDVCTVAVPHDHSAGSIASAREQAAAAAAYYRAFQTAPPGFQLIGEGAGGGTGAASERGGSWAIPVDIIRLALPAPATPWTSLGQESLVGVAEASVPVDDFHSTWASLALDGHFATTHEEGFRMALPRREFAAWAEENGPTLDLVGF